MSETILETDRLILESWRPDQLEDVMALHSDPLVTQYLTFSGTVWTPELAQEKLTSWIALFQSQRLGKHRVLRKSDQRFIGRAGFSISQPTGAPELGYTFFREHWGQGYATEAAAALRDWIFANTDEPHFIGFADARNLASISVLKKIGMIPTHVADYEGGLKTQFLKMERPAP